MSAALDREQATRRVRRPMLLVLVFAIFLALVGITASALVAITSAHLSTATLNATLSRDASLVELFVNGNLRPDDLVTGANGSIRTSELNGKLRSLTRDDQILRVDVRGPDGSVLFSSEPSSVGQRPGLSAAMRGALDGKPSATMARGGELHDLAGAAPEASTVVEEYLPIVSEGGHAKAVVGLWRDAGPVLASIDAAERDVVVVVLGSALVLAAILFLVFRAAQARISRQQAQLLEATRRDPLTELLNHGAIVAMLADLVETTRRDGGRLAVALLDIDNFKLFNEAHGHHAADAVLCQVAELLNGDETDTDHAARYGPDEFALVWVGASAADAEGRVAALRGRLADVSLQFGDSERLPVTVSGGIAVFPEHAASVTELLSAATVALQEAKAGGGDAVRVVETGKGTKVAGSFDVLQGLVIAVDTKDRYTKRHSEDVARYAVFLAKRLGLDGETLRTVRISGLLHDVGKIGIPDTLLRKPSKLTAQEFDVFKQHVALGDAIVRDLPNVAVVREGIRHHHERWDGRGYLEGLEGEEIPLIGRIMAVADAFSAMTTTRPYRKALSVQEALKRLGDAAGTQLEEGLVQSFIQGLETASDAPMPGDDPARIWVPERRVA